MKKWVNNKLSALYEIVADSQHSCYDRPISLTHREFKTIKGAYSKMALAQKIIKQRLEVEGAKENHES